MRSAGILQKLQPNDGLEEQRDGVKSDLESVNLGDATPLLVVWAVSILVGSSLLILERKTRRMMLGRPNVTVQNILHAL
jgi:beta-lactamase regulating signal transducer with metallopeptidase domain